MIIFFDKGERRGCGEIAPSRSAHRRAGDGQGRDGGERSVCKDDTFSISKVISVYRRFPFHMKQILYTLSAKPICVQKVIH